MHESSQHYFYGSAQPPLCILGVGVDLRGSGLHIGTKRGVMDHETRLFYSIRHCLSFLST